MKTREQILQEAYHKGFEKGASSATDALRAGRELWPNVARGVTAGGLMDTAQGTLQPFNYNTGSGLSPTWRRHELAHWSKGPGLLPSLKEEMRAGYASGAKYNMTGQVARSPIRGVTEAIYQGARHPHYLGNTFKGKLLASKPVQAGASAIRNVGNVAGNVHAGLRMYGRDVAAKAAPAATAALAAGKAYAAPAAAAAGKFVALPAAAAAAGTGIGYDARRLLNHSSGGRYDKGMNAAGNWLADQTVGRYYGVRGAQ